MKRPIWAYGHTILREPCEDIEQDYPELKNLIADMWDTMNHANGCGLAAPQIGHPIRLFIVDSKSTFDNLQQPDRRTYFDKNDRGISETFINARIIDRSVLTWQDEEGCLSIPSLTQKINRNWEITIEYFNEAFIPQRRTFGGATARMVQHEYDHTQGVLFLDYLKPLTKRLLESKLKRIQKGKIQAKYAMKFV